MLLFKIKDKTLNKCLGKINKLDEFGHFKQPDQTKRLSGFVFL